MPRTRIPKSFQLFLIQSVKEKSIYLLIGIKNVLQAANAHFVDNSTSDECQCSVGPVVLTVLSNSEDQDSFMCRFNWRLDLIVAYGQEYGEFLPIVRSRKK